MPNETQSGNQRRYVLVCSAVVTTIVAAAAILRVLAATGPSRDYDEGVYWQSLISLRNGFYLYKDIFASQPPLFVLSLYPMADFSSSIALLRLWVAMLSMVGLAGAYYAGRALSDRLGGIAATFLLGLSPSYLEGSERLQADAPATALVLLSLGCALTWLRSYRRWISTALAAFCAIFISLGILIKLFDFVAAIPICLLIFQKLWLGRRSTIELRSILIDITFGIGAAILTVIAVCAPFAAVSHQLYQQVIQFHADARLAFPLSIRDNLGIVFEFLQYNMALASAALIGTCISIWRKDAKVIALLAWLLGAVALLVMQTPLFSHHTIILVPPLVILASLLFLPNVEGLTRRPYLAVAIIAFVGLAMIRSDVHYFEGLESSSYRRAAARDTIMANDLKRHVIEGGIVITDDQFVAALAQRAVPPWLVDTSNVRAVTRYFALSDLMDAASSDKVQAVSIGQKWPPYVRASFESWLPAHGYALVRSYEWGPALWVRR